MGNYDNKLGEWFKLVEQQEQELKAKKDVDPAEAVEEPKPVAQEQPQPERAEVESSAKEVPASVIATIDTKEVIADTTLVEQIEPEPDGEIVEEEHSDAAPSLFDDKDVSQVEDFFSFLDRTREEEPASLDTAPLPEVPELRRPAGIVEGTGQPRPISSTTTPELDTTLRPESEIQLPPSRRRAESPAPVEPEVLRPPEPPREPAIQPPVEGEAAKEKWDRVPHHLQTLFTGADEEVAQHSYKTFKETRGELIQRLLDPVVSLEEAARILDVCPTTVRRYTNRGILKHLRTAGNQRRFRLSDVLNFMESGAKRSKDAADGAS